MKSLTIKTQYDPKRCEICHKNDLFDGSSNFCFRCKEYYPTQPKINNNKQSSFLLSTQKHRRRYIYDRASNCLLSFSFLFTTVVLFALQRHKIEDVKDFAFYLIVFTLALSGSILAAYLDKKIYGKTFVKMMIVINLPAVSLIVLLGVAIISLFLFGVC